MTHPDPIEPCKWCGNMGEFDGACDECRNVAGDGPVKCRMGCGRRTGWHDDTLCEECWQREWGHGHAYAARDRDRADWNRQVSEAIEAIKRR